MSNSILQEILEHQRKTIDIRKSQTDVSELNLQIHKTPPPKGFFLQLEKFVKRKKVTVIAEIKKSSPSQGLLVNDYQPETIARNYENLGACCVSVLTTELYFNGSLSHLQKVTQSISLPVLRKDFIIDPYQIYESRAFGADCVLLILSILDDHDAHLLENQAMLLGLDVIIEVTDHQELERALKMKSLLIGINHRNLHTLEVDMQKSLNLVRHVPKNKIVVAESGINSLNVVQQLVNQNIYAFLIGHHFLLSKNLKLSLQQILKITKSLPP